MTIQHAARLQATIASAMIAGITLIGSAGVAAKEAPDASGKETALEARVQRLEDNETIRVLLERYIELNESRDYATYAQLFAKDGELVMRRGRATGPSAIQAMLEKNFGGANTTTPSGDPLTGSTHVLSNVKIQVDGDTATATSRWTLLVRGEDDRPRLGGTGHYGDKLVRENGVWKFQQRIIYRDIPGDAPAAKK